MSVLSTSPTHLSTNLRSPAASGTVRRSLRLVLLGAAFLVCWLSGYGIEQQKFLYAHAWSFADPVCAVLLITVTILLTTGHFRVDPPARWMFVYVLAYLISMAGNSTWTAGGTLNFLRTTVFALALYILAHNCIATAKDLTGFYLMSAALGLTMAFQGIAVLIGHWGTQFTNLLPVMGNTPNLMNAWGFVLVMFFSVSLSWWARSPKSIARAAACGFLGIGIALSLSRTAYSCLAIVLFLAVAGGRLKNSLKLAVLGFAIGVFMWLTISEIHNAFPDAMTFLQIKFDNYQADLINTRLDQLTIQPLREWTDQGPQVWLIGDAKSEQHNLFVNCFWMTGIIGTLAMLTYEVSLFRAATRLRRSSAERAHAVGLTLLTLVTVMFLDDFLTNLRNHSATVAYVFAVLAGCLSSDMVTRRNGLEERIWLVVSNGR